jgi:hypothetical protein
MIQVIQAATEEYNGSSWTTITPGLNTARSNLAAAGIQTAALAFGGDTPSDSAATEEYNGSTWTTSPGSLNTARGKLSGCGTQTAALGIGGYAATIKSTATEEYDGSTWTTSPGSMNTARAYVSSFWNTNSSFSFLVIYHLQEQQNYMMVLLGHQIQQD